MLVSVSIDLLSVTLDSRREKYLKIYFRGIQAASSCAAFGEEWFSSINMCSLVFELTQSLLDGCLFTVGKQPLPVLCHCLQRGWHSLHEECEVAPTPLGMLLLSQQGQTV